MNAWIEARQSLSRTGMGLTIIVDTGKYVWGGSTAERRRTKRRWTAFNSVTGGDTFRVEELELSVVRPKIKIEIHGPAVPIQIQRSDDDHTRCGGNAR